MATQSTRGKGRQNQQRMGGMETGYTCVKKPRKVRKELFECGRRVPGSIVRCLEAEALPLGDEVHGGRGPQASPTTQQRKEGQPTQGHIPQNEAAGLQL